MDEFSARRPGLTVLLGTLIVGLPLLVALVDLHSKHWYPVLDLAMTEFRVRDVGWTHTPLIGLPGRIAPGSEQGSHPGPLSFYLLAPVYRLLGSSSWALQAATVAIHLAAIATALWIGHRRAGWRGVLAVGALLALVIRGYGQILLTQPWNPYLPLLMWIVVLLGVWAVACGDTLMLIPTVIAGSFCAQTHVPYLLTAGGLTIAALLLAAVRSRTSSGPERHVRTRTIVVASGLGVVLWIPPVIDQMLNDPGNIRKLIDHFGSPPDEPLGFSEGVRLAFRHLDVWAGFAGQFADTGRFVSPSSTGRGAVMLAVWIVAAAFAVRFGSGALRALHAVVGAALLLGAVSMMRIFGLPWYYLTLWAWGTSAVALGAVGWTALIAWRRSADVRPFSSSVIPALSVAILAIGSAVSAVSFASADVPEERLSIAVEALADATHDAIVDGVGAASGPDATYQVRWSDAADIGSPGFGLLNALERSGLDVRADTWFHIPATEYRVRDRSTEGVQVVLATGAYIAKWRVVPFAVEVASYEPRSADELGRYHQTRRQLIDRLTEEGLVDLLDEVDVNLFGGSLDPRLSEADRNDFTVMLDLGQPMSVFIVPDGIDPVF